MSRKPETAESRAKREKNQQLANNRKRELKVKQKENESAYMVMISGILNKMFYRQSDSRYIIHCGPTNSGKTYNALLSLKQTNKTSNV